MGVGRVTIVTGGGRGIGREHCLALAARGDAVVVNDLGVDLAGNGVDPGPARSVAAEIRAAGGVAIPSTHDVSDESQAAALVQRAIEEFGRVNALVNNAGVIRDAMFASMSATDWDVVIRGTLRSQFLVTQLLSAYWRAQAKAGIDLAPRIVNTTSGAGLFGSVGQANYSAAKAAICAATLVQAAELRRYDVLVNAVAPVARTRLTESVFAETMAQPTDGFDHMHPRNISPAVVWLASAENTTVSGRAFEIEGESITVCLNWQRGPTETSRGGHSFESAGHAISVLHDGSPDRVPVYGQIPVPNGRTSK